MRVCVLSLNWQETTKPRATVVTGLSTLIIWDHTSLDQAQLGQENPHHTQKPWVSWTVQATATEWVLIFLFTSHVSVIHRKPSVKWNTESHLVPSGQFLTHTANAVQFASTSDPQLNQTRSMSHTGFCDAWFSFLYKKNTFYYMRMNFMFWLHIYLCVIFVSGTHRNEKVLDPLGLEL